MMKMYNEFQGSHLNPIIVMTSYFKRILTAFNTDDMGCFAGSQTVQ